MAAPPGDTHRLFVVQQGGQIALIKDGSVLPQPFLDISSKVHYVGGEQGLLSMAFAPDYASTGRFYVYYTSTHCPNPPGCDEHVSEFTADPGRDSGVALRGRSAHDPASRPGQPQRRPTAVRARRRPLRLGRRRRRRRRHRAQRPEQEHAARKAAAHRARDDVLHDPRGQSVQRRREVLERHQWRVGLPRDLGLRLAQPVALLVRQHDRRPRHRRRRPESGRGDRLRRAGPERRRQLWLALL